MPVSEIADPVAYGWWWLPLGIVLVSSVVWLPVLIVVLTRRKKDTAPPAPRTDVPTAPASRRDPFAAARAAHLARIDALEQRLAAGEIDVRGLALGLRDVLRDFASVRTGVPTAAMTESDARAEPQVRKIVTLLERTTNPAFGRSPRGTGTVALRDARKVVSTW